MLYEKNRAPFSEELFKNPTCEYRGTPFWAWNCKLEREELLRQIDVLRTMGFGGFHMHVRTGMATDYMSPEYMQLIRDCVDKAKADRMLAWLYDEDRWPSGAAGGKVTQDERFRTRSLQFQPEPFAPDPKRKDLQGRATLLACYDVRLNEKGELIASRRIGENDPAEGTKWYAYLKIADLDPWYNGFCYVDTMNRRAIDRFIETTHELYAEKIGDEFGKTVPAIFSDEPHISVKRRLNSPTDKMTVSISWTDDLPETFRAACGEDLLERLPELFWELPDGRVSTVRYHYFDHVAERFAEAFSDNIGKWCEDHGILLTGHVLNEPSLQGQSSVLSECMRAYRSFGIPGIDMLCNNYEFSTAKQCQSAVHQYGRPGMLSELYGVTGWDYDLRSHKLQGDWQAALGVTVRVPHLAWLSMHGEAKRDYPASINYQSPWYTEYSYIEDHFARVNTALTRGKPVVRVGVIHPVESYWIRSGPNDVTADARQSLENRFQSLIEWLLKSQIDFDLISESLLPEQCAEGGAPLQVGCMAYDAVVVPGCETLRTTTYERLKAFREAGGRLIFIGNAPAMLDAVPSDAPAALWRESVRVDNDKSQILAALREFRSVELRNLNQGGPFERFLYQMRQDGEEKWLFLAPAGMPRCMDVSPTARVGLTIRGEYAVTLYDTLTGEKRPFPHRAAGGVTEVPIECCEMDSFLFRLTPAPGSVYAEQKESFPEKPIEVPTSVSYTLSEPNVLLLDIAEFALDDEPYEPAEEILRADDRLRDRLGWPRRKSKVVQPYMVPEEEPKHSMRMRFTVRSRIETPVTLALESAEQTQIRWNGEAIAAAPDGWYVDRSIRCVRLGTAKIGENVLELVLPYVRRSEPEWCYLLGRFGVEAAGRERVLCELPENLAFDSLTAQRMPYYGGNVTYRLDVCSDGGEVRLEIPHYRGGILRVAVDGEDRGHICIQPYALALGKLSAGKHRIDVTLFGNRFNSFGHLHNANLAERWIGPDAWRSVGQSWTYEYRLRPLGLLSAPNLFEKV